MSAPPHQKTVIKDDDLTWEQQRQPIQMKQYKREAAICNMFEREYRGIYSWFPTQK